MNACCEKNDVSSAALVIDMLTLNTVAVMHRGETGNHRRLVAVVGSRLSGRRQNAAIRVTLIATDRSFRTLVKVFWRSVYTRNTSLSGA